MRVAALGMSLALSSLPVLVMAAEAPSIELALRFRPVQKDVEYETPPANQYRSCQVKVERLKTASGWIVTGPAGQTLRRFVDTNSDNVVDEWRYYQHGIEVYRDLDTDYNNKVDQSRWLNTGGTRWGIDSNEDGQIDHWKRLSAEEATRVAVHALVENNLHAFQTLLIDSSDLRQLGISDSVAKRILESVRNSDQKIRTLRSTSRIFSQQTKWMRFDSTMPGIIPSDTGKAQADLLVYENAMAIVETAGKPTLVQFGEIVRVGDVWKLTQIPRPLEGNSVQVASGGFLMRPELSNAVSSSTTTVSPQMQKLLQQLQSLSEHAPPSTAGRAALAQYSTQRADLLSKLVDASTTQEDKNQWLRQLIDSLASGIQTGAFPEGLSRLKSLESDIRRKSSEPSMLAYVAYRRLMAEYSLAIQSADASHQQEIQEQWLRDLKQFIKSHPQSNDAADAMLQLAINHEFAGQTGEAKKWYTSLAKQYPKTAVGTRAAGAIRRLELPGRPLQLSGPGLNGAAVDIGRYRGRVVLVFFWATWCKPCTEDLPQLRALYTQYHDRGFEIVGVNLDTTVKPVRPFLAQNGVTWPQIFQPGGLEGPVAQSFGIISLPTLFLVDASGKLVSNNATISDLKTHLPQLLKKSPSR